VHGVALITFVLVHLMAEPAPDASQARWIQMEHHIVGGVIFTGPAPTHYCVIGVMKGPGHVADLLRRTAFIRALRKNNRLEASAYRLPGSEANL
jgi:hypothetical protein